MRKALYFPDLGYEGIRSFGRGLLFGVVSPKPIMTAPNPNPVKGRPSKVAT